MGAHLNLQTYGAFILALVALTNEELLAAVEEEEDLSSWTHPVEGLANFHRLISLKVEEHVELFVGYHIELELAFDPAFADPTHILAGTFRTKVVALCVAVATVDAFEAVVDAYRQWIL